MNPKEALAVLVAAFRTELNEQTVGIYCGKMKDIPPDLLAATIHRVIDQNRFFPSVAEIRETAALLAWMLPPSAEEVLRIIREADRSVPVMRRDGSYAYTERVWEWPADLAPDTLRMIREAMGRVGDPVDDDGKHIFGWEQGFKKSYEHIAGEARAHALRDLSSASLSAAPKALP